MNRASAVVLGIVWLISVAVAVGVTRLSTGPLPTLAPLVRRVGPSVVSVDVSGDVPGKGSGFAVSPTEVVTARHLVVDTDAIEIRTAGGRTLAARVLGTDARTDLALLEVPDAELPPVRLGRGDRVTVGDWVIGVGNALGLGPTPVVGIVAQQGSRLDAAAPGPRVEFWQLSLALNPGHSGGPVFDDRGRVVAVLQGRHTQGQAVAFAVPIEAFRAVEERLRGGEAISRAYLGLQPHEQDGRLVVTSVVPSSPADRGALRPGDVLVALDDTPLSTERDLQRVLDRLSGGVQTTLVIERGGQPREARVQLTDWAQQPVVVAGMTLVPADGAGASIVALTEGSRADRAGLRVGDLVRALDGMPVQAPATIRDHLVGGAGARLQVFRDDQLRQLSIAGREPIAPRRAPR